MGDPDSFPNIRKLFATGCVSPNDSTGAELGTSSMRQLKTPYRYTISDSREGYLNLVQLPKLTETDV